MANDGNSYRPRRTRAGSAGRTSTSRRSTGGASRKRSSSSTTSGKAAAAKRSAANSRNRSASGSRGSAGSRKPNPGHQAKKSSRKATYANATSRSRKFGRYDNMGFSSPKGIAVGDALRSAGQVILGNRILLAAVIVVAVLLVGALWDNLSNWGKAYANVSVNGVSVAGMTEEELRASLQAKYGEGLASAEIKLYASEDAKNRELNGEDPLYPQDVQNALAAAEGEEFTEVSDVTDPEDEWLYWYGEQEEPLETSWTVTSTTVGASVPIDAAVKEAMEAGRDGGPFARFGVMFFGHDVELDVSFDEGKLENLAELVDKASGNPLMDASVEIEDGQAHATEGHSGSVVDRSWLRSSLADSLMAGGSSELVATVSESPSRTTSEQAEQAAASINNALMTGAVFTYKGQRFEADNYDLGSWTTVSVEQVGDAYEIVPHIDSSLATSDVVKNVEANVSSDDVNVTFEKAGSEIVVKTSGTGMIPEIGPAVDKLEEQLYGTSGVYHASSASSTPVSIEITESDAPEMLTFDQAMDLGIITEISSYTTEFTNEEGTENRNHNIRTAADLINDSIVRANGGSWSFNETSGDTNLDPPFASAGSIVNGEYVDSIGGGICQVATTVFNAVYEAGLDIDTRWNHTLYIASYPTGRDAAVTYPELDLVWSNPLPSDVLMRLDYTDTSITCHLYSVYTGMYAETETGAWEEGKKYTTRFEVDNSMAEGMAYLKTNGVDGTKISVTRTVYDKDGKFVSSNTFASEYAAKDEVYVVGPGTDTSNLVRKTDNS